MYSIFNKVKIQETIKFCEKMNISYYKNNVFVKLNVTRETNYKILCSDSARRRHNQTDYVNTRSKNNHFVYEIREMKKILKKKEMKTRELI